MKRKQAVYLNVFKIKLPLAGIVSLLHRITGILLVLAIPFALNLLALSLRDEAGFHQVTNLLDSPLLIFIEVIFFTLLIYHFFTGVRFLLLDIDVGLSKDTAKLSSWIVIIATVFSTLIFSAFRIVS